MDAQKKNLLLELCDQMDERLQVQSAHLELAPDRNLNPNRNLPLSLNKTLRDELSLLRTCILSESTPQQITAAAWHARKHP